MKAILLTLFLLSSSSQAAISPTIELVCRERGFDSKALTLACDNGKKLVVIPKSRAQAKYKFHSGRRYLLQVNHNEFKQYVAAKKFLKLGQRKVASK